MAEFIIDMVKLWSWFLLLGYALSNYPPKAAENTIEHDHPWTNVSKEKLRAAMLNNPCDEIVISPSPEPEPKPEPNFRRAAVMEKRRLLALRAKDAPLDG